MSRIMRNRLLTILSILLLLVVIQYETDRNKIIDDLTHKSISLEADNERLEFMAISLSNLNRDTMNKYDELEVQYSELLNNYNTLKEGISSGGGTSRGSESKRTTKQSYVLHATGYIANHGNPPWYGITKSGVKAKEWYTVAVDTSQFPLGTVFYIPELEKYNGTGIYVAEDTGSAIGYGDIDICVPTVDECYSEIGSRKIEVFVIEYGTGKVNR